MLEEVSAHRLSRQPASADDNTSHADRRATLFNAFRAWWRENRRSRRFTEVGLRLVRELWHFAREATPGRRKQRYGDIEFDCDYRVNTTSANVSRKSDLLGMLAGTPYQPCDPALFHSTIRSLNINCREFEFIDVGCGKGRALLLASDYPFRRILGVELLSELQRIAEHNIQIYKSSARQCFSLESICADAREFEFPSVPLVVFLFNPLPEAGLRSVVANLARSLQQHPRPVHVVYHNPILKHVLQECSALEERVSTVQYAIYDSAAF